MSAGANGRAHALESGLFGLSKDAPALAWTLQRLLPAPALEQLLRQAGAPRANMPAAALARLLVSRPRIATALALAILEHAPAAPAAPAPAAETNGAESWRELLRESLASGNAAGIEAARGLHQALGDSLPPAAAPSAPAPAAVRKAGTPRRRSPRAAAEHGGDAGAETARAEIAKLQQELAQERERRRELAEQAEQARAEAREERARATALKRRLAAATDASERERSLAEAAAQAQRDLGIVQQKFKLVEEERDDLRGCLEDHDRFQSLPEEEVPSFRNRPLLAEEVELSARLAGVGRSFRVLVVGGGEPQHRHREKLVEYAEALGFTAEWRMAEYGSWHRELAKLDADMKSRFDAMVILHWNRTTFTRHARTICDAAGHKPCLTCRYEGFTSLRTALRECLRQLLERPAGA